MTQKLPVKLTGRVYHGWLDARVVSVDRVHVYDGVVQATDRMPWAPPQVGTLFRGFSWGDPAGDACAANPYRKSKAADLAYAILNDCRGRREFSLRYTKAFACQVLASIGSTVPFQMLGSQVQIWIKNQLRADSSPGAGQMSRVAAESCATYCCPVCGSLEFETATRKAGAWCHFYPMENMILCDPLALGGDVHHLPSEMKTAATAADGFGWSDEAHAAAGVKPANEFGPGARVLSRPIGGVE